MRIIKTVFIILLVLTVVLLAGLFLFIRSFDANRYKGRLADEIGRRLERDIDLDRIDLTLHPSQGLSLVLEGLQVADVPSFSSEPFLSVAKIRLQINPFDYVRTRRITIARVDIVSPRLRLIRDPAGKLNIPALNPPRAEVSSDSGLVSAPDPSRGAASSADHSSMPAVAWEVDQLRLQDGTITWMDQGQKRQLTLTKTDILLDHFSFQRPFKLEINSTLFADEPDIHFKGSVRLGEDNRTVLLQDAQFKADLKAMTVSKLASLLPEISSAGLQDPLGGQIAVMISRLVVSSKGIDAMALDGSLREARVNLTSLPASFQAVRSDFVLSDDVLTVKDFSAEVSSGTLTGTAKLTNLKTTPAFSLKAKIEGVPAEAVLPPLDSQARLTGMIEGEAQLSSRGRSQNDILRSLTGPVAVKILDGKLENMNVLRVVLERISIVPNLVEKIYAQLPEKYAEQLEKDETVFQQLVLRMQGKAGGLVIEEGRVTAEAFMLTATGQLDDNLDLDLNARLLIPSDLSAAMTAAVEELEYVLDQEGQIAIPLQYRGPVRRLRPLPDLNYLSKRILVNRGAEELDKLLDKVFDREEPDGSPDDESSPEESPQKSPERELIENLLDTILN